MCGAVNPPAPSVQSIPQIQGSGPSSPFVGIRLTTEGIVTHKVNNGFYLQDPSGDGDHTTSDGIFVFTGTAPAVNVGDRLRLTATVAEFNAGNPQRTETWLIVAKLEAATDRSDAARKRLDELLALAATTEVMPHIVEDAKTLRDSLPRE